MRYAIYHSPAPKSLLHLLGTRWLGRDAFTGESAAQPDIPGIGVVTGDPRRYGFHATLKPPFALRDTLTAEALMRAMAALAASEESLEVNLEVAVLDGFLALVPRRRNDALHALADRVVRDLDGFRLPPAADEIARRRAVQLSPREEANLADWGYPHVFEDFRFHMTLTERLPQAYVERFKAAAEQHFAPALAEPMPIDALTLFEEPSRGLPFLATRRFALSRSKAEAAA